MQDMCILFIIPVPPSSGDRLRSETGLFCAGSACAMIGVIINANAYGNTR